MVFFQLKNQRPEVPGVKSSDDSSWFVILGGQDVGSFKEHLHGWNSDEKLLVHRSFEDGKKGKVENVLHDLQVVLGVLLGDGHIEDPHTP